MTNQENKLKHKSFILIDEEQIKKNPYGNELNYLDIETDDFI